MRTKFFISAIGFASLALAGCTSTETNTNANVRTNMNANLANNTAIVVNSDTNRPNTNTNRWSNTNMTREEYEKSRAEYERDKGNSSIGQGANDSWIWFKTRAALLTTNDLRESTINVDVANDVVTLRGTVETAAQKTKAEQVAKGIDGVKSVKNELKVAANDSMTNTGGNSNNRATNANTNRR